MLHLTDGSSEAEVAQVLTMKSAMCTVFRKQFAGGMEPCYTLRKAIVDFKRGNL
jgi:hypothetical protein